MNKKTKTNLILCLVLGVGLSLFFNMGVTREKVSEESQEIEIAITLSEKIHIDNNWSAAEIAGICTGNGTFTNPYVIEDLVIDGEGTGSCIFIENSNDYFRIENCSVFNSDSYPHSGIRLLKVNNSKLVENNCTLNRYGIELDSCFNNTLTGNTAMDNSHAIHLDNSENNTISGNFLNNNSHYGLSIYYSINNTVSGNELNYNNWELESLEYDPNIDRIIINDVLKLDRYIWFEIEKFVKKNTEWDYELEKSKSAASEKSKKLIRIIETYSDLFSEGGIENLILKTYLFQKTFTSIEIFRNDHRRTEEFIDELREFFFVGYVPYAKAPRNSGQVLISRFKHIFEVGLEYMKRCEGIHDFFSDLFGLLFEYSSREIAQYCSTERLKSLDLIK
jgi:parallel beta-helix repeat protein